MPKKYIPMKERAKLFHVRKKKLQEKLKTDQNLTSEERKKLTKKLSRMGKGSIRTVRG
tara:strand:- start:748 stop:921 length:174 start_codon:yes stop_codon:yes gene_type:complete